MRLSLSSVIFEGIYGGDKGGETIFSRSPCPVSRHNFYREGRQREHLFAGWDEAERSLGVDEYGVRRGVGSERMHAKELGGVVEGRGLS